MPPQNQPTPESQLPVPSGEVKINTPETRPLSAEEIEALRQKMEAERSPQVVQPTQESQGAPLAAAPAEATVNTPTEQKSNPGIDLRLPVAPDAPTVIKSLGELPPHQMVIGRNNAVEALGYGIATDDEAKAA
jgi:hypothetical protein